VNLSRPFAYCGLPIIAIGPSLATDGEFITPRGELTHH